MKLTCAILVTIIYGSIIKLCTTEVVLNAIALDDILSEDYMPATLLMLENPKGLSKYVNRSFEEGVSSIDQKLDGTLGKAIKTMYFHRSMMNQYLCRSFLAEQIVTNMSTSRVKRRMGHATSDIGEPANTSFDIKKNLIYDEGSSGYKDWLSKSTTLEDIYRHYDNPQSRKDVPEEEEEEENVEDFEEGYNVNNINNKHETKAALNHRHEETYFAGGEYPSSYANYGPTSYNQQNYGPPPEFHHNDGGGYPHSLPESPIYEPYVEPEYHSQPPKYHVYNYFSKEKDLADLFEIALTALAFLAFKMFIVHVIMCITTVTNNSTTTTMTMAMSMSPTATGTGIDMPDLGEGGMSDTGDGMPGTGIDMPSTGGGMTSTGGGMTSTGGGMTSTGGEMTSTGGGMTSTGGGMTSTGGGMTSTGGGMPSTGGDMPSTGGGMTSTGGGLPGTGGGMTITEGGGTTGGGSTGNGESSDGSTDMGGGTGSSATGTGGGMTSTGAGQTGTGSTDNTSTGTGTAADGGTGTAAEESSTGDGASDSLKFRFRRSALPILPNSNNEVINELSRKILVTIESALISHLDDGVCLKKTLCENNKWSRDLEGKHKIFIPLWSLGMSWLSGRIVKNVAASTTMLDTLKASILGLGKANCEIIYQKCDLRGQVMERKRRKRRKRESYS